MTIEEQCAKWVGDELALSSPSTKDRLKTFHKMLETPSERTDFFQDLVNMETWLRAHTPDRKDALDACQKVITMLSIAVVVSNAVRGKEQT